MTRLRRIWWRWRYWRSRRAWIRAWLRARAFHEFWGELEDDLGDRDDIPIRIFLRTFAAYVALDLKYGFFPLRRLATPEKRNTAEEKAECAVQEVTEA